MTTSIPEARGLGPQLGLSLLLAARRLFRRRRAEPPRRDRNDGRAISRYIVGIAAGVGDGRCSPSTGSTATPRSTRASSKSLPGYRGMGPVRIGNDAYRQMQHDVYGSAVLAATHVFFDERLISRGDAALFERLEALGRRALAVYDQPDAGLWELRGSPRVHTFSSVMCWAACDRLARIAARLGIDRTRRGVARAMPRASALHRRALLERGARQLRRHRRRRRARREPAAAGRPRLLAPDDPRFVATVRAIETRAEARRFRLSLRRAGRLRRAGATRSSSARSGTSTRWRRSAAATRRARCSSGCSPCRNRHGLLAEHLDPAHRRAVGQLRADLQHGRAHQRGDPPVGAVGRRVLKAPTPGAPGAALSRARDRMPAAGPATLQQQSRGPHFPN